jgi:hypothetical protein
MFAVMRSISFLWVCFLGTLEAQIVSIPLAVDPGVPMRLYLTQRLSMRVGEIAKAKVIEPVYVFDRIVIPAGAEVSGQVMKLGPVSALAQTQSILGGNFTPLHRARVEFTQVRLADGKTIPIHTETAVGLPTVYEPPKPPKPKKQGSANKPAASSSPLRELAAKEVKQELNAQINAQLNAHTYGLGSMVRGPNKKERLVDFLLAKSPYRPQWYRRGTRFDAVLKDRLDFGSTSIAAESLRELGNSATLDRAAQIRFVSSVSSATAKVGDPVEAILSQPLTDGAKLILPEGTHLSGEVRQVRPARWLHRAGQLRFTFDQLKLPATVASLPAAPPERSEARLEVAETDPAAAVKIDSEGTAKATESKTRMLRPLIAAAVAVMAMDNDTGKTTSAGGNGSGNAGGLALGGFSGFGLLGVALSQVSSVAGSALGMYGLAVSVYSNVVSRGHEVEFKESAAMQIRFGPRPVPGPKREAEASQKTKLVSPTAAESTGTVH